MAPTVYRRRLALLTDGPLCFTAAMDPPAFSFVYAPSLPNAWRLQAAFEPLRPLCFKPGLERTRRSVWWLNKWWAVCCWSVQFLINLDHKSRALSTRCPPQLGIPLFGKFFQQMLVIIGLVKEITNRLHQGSLYILGLFSLKSHGAYGKELRDMPQNENEVIF